MRSSCWSPTPRRSPSRPTAGTSASSTPTATNVTFALQACVSTRLSGDHPAHQRRPLRRVRRPAASSPLRPGPPQRFFFDFIITNAVPGVLFELYNLSGDADLVLQRAVPPTMAPYFDGSFSAGTTPEQIVAADQRRRARPARPLVSGRLQQRADQRRLHHPRRPAQHQRPAGQRPAAPGWRSRRSTRRTACCSVGTPSRARAIIVQYTASIAAPVTWTNIGFVTATTPLTTFEVLPVPTRRRLLPDRPGLLASSQPTLYIQLWPTNQVRISWSTAYPGYTLQSKTRPVRHLGQCRPPRERGRQ